MCRPRFSYQDSVAVIHLMLNDLCRKAGELVLLFAKFYVAVYDFKPFMPHRFSLSGEGETSLLGLVLLGGCFYNLRIQHDKMRFPHAYGDDALLFANLSVRCLLRRGRLFPVIGVFTAYWRHLS